MKNIKMYFGVIAFVLGVGSVLASQFTVYVPGYQRILNAQGVVTACDFKGLCCAGPFVCKFRISTTPLVTVPLFSNDVIVQNCGQPLTQNANAGIINP